MCYGTGGIHTPGVIVTGTPAPGTCQGQSALSGSATGTGPKTLCCL
jgi:hypothetical protein